MISSLVSAISRTSLLDLSGPNKVGYTLRKIPSAPLGTRSKHNSNNETNGILTTRLLEDNGLSNPLSRSGFFSGFKILGFTAQKIDLTLPHQVIRHNGRRAGVGPRGNNGKRGVTTIQGAFQSHPHKKKFKKTLSRRFPGHVDIFNREG